MLTPLESRYVEAYQNAIAAVSSVNGFVSQSQNDYLRGLELHFDFDRIDDLRDIARERFNAS